MTLVAAFRCRNTGILLCADREEDDSYTKREVDKIFRAGFHQFELFIAGAGLTTAVMDAWAEINRDLQRAANLDKRDIEVEHRSVIESSLRTIHAKHKNDLKNFPLYLLIVVALRKQNSIPILYRTDRSTLIEEGYYAAVGTGKLLSDYFASYLYKHGAQDDYLAVLASFILKEAEKYASGVGHGNDMVFICPNGLLKFLSKESIAEIQAGIPDLKDAIHSCWAERLKVPAWLKDYAASSGLTA
ncbi:MAG TPA: hypothetical protein VGR81_08530 [Candidatus Acidoferrales bacterium]|nr:hypothetical protein [Candidatus Acidoferrales bacterium]